MPTTTAALSPALAAELAAVAKTLAQAPMPAPAVVPALPAMPTPARPELAKVIDHTLLKASASTADIDRLCAEARRYGFASVCVHTAFVSRCAQLLAGSQVLVCTVVGFPLGTSTSATKAFEAKEAVQNGAGEVDMVLSIGALREGRYAEVQADIAEVVAAAAPIPVKVILEVGELTREQKIVGCLLSQAAGAAFVKTSTGFGPGGATVEDIALMRAVVGPSMQVKASGGVRTAADVDAMLAAGADRIGASASVAIVQGPVEGQSATGGGGY
jgi:deoxyribose-phosphate aldolase